MIHSFIHSFIHSLNSFIHSYIPGSKAEAAQWANKIVTLEEEIERLKLENDQLMGEKADILHEKDLASKEAEEKEAKMRQENDEVSQEKQQLNEELDRVKKENEGWERSQ